MRDLDRINKKFKETFKFTEGLNKSHKILSLDLELNKSTDSNIGGVTTDIIQIGACVIDTRKLEIIDTFSRYIKIETPMDNGELRLSRFITTLTGINDETLQREGISLIEAVSDLFEFSKKHQVMRNGLEWGYNDFNHLYESYINLGGDPAFWYFARSHFDAKKIFQTYRIFKGLKPYSGLAKSIKLLGFDFIGKKHNALDDAINTALVWLILGNKITKDNL